jgi:membrane-bound lytic murein transglycosylase D
MEFFMRVFFSTFVAMSLVAVVAFQAGIKSFAAKQALNQSIMAEMDREATVFNRMKGTVSRGDECAPIRVGGKGQIDLQYLACSESALRLDGQGFDVSDNISVPSSIARRVNFWRRVYSLWSKNQNVLHVAEYPEVVLEIHDSSRLIGVGDKARDRVMKPWIQARRQFYRQILWKLASLKNIDELKLTATERRVYHLFDHIDDKRKFKLAANALRVQRGQREYIAKGLEVASKYLPHAEAEFKRQGLMPELARIAFIESSFNLQALSKVGASGVYQVMPETGRDYLVVTPEIDERNDPIKASRAAAKLLALNYKILGQWPLAVTAYNHGVGGITRAMREMGTKDIVVLINKYDGNNFGFASKNFYSGFLGLLASLKNSAKVFPEVKLAQPLNFDLIKVGGMSLAAVKSKYKLSTSAIIAYNPDISRKFIRAGGTFPRRYVMKIPVKSHSGAKLVAFRR